MTLRPPDAQESFAAGMVPGIAPHLIPPNGVALLRNYLLDDDGSMYGRSGTTLKTAVLEAGQAANWVWDGFLAAGHRTLMASQGKLGVLAADDTTLIQVSNVGLAYASRPAVLNGIMFLPNIAYAGSRKTVDYSTGSVSVTAGSTTVVGAGTAWNANVDAGMLLIVGGVLVAVASVTDDTHLELSSPWPGATAAGALYAARVAYTLPSSMYAGSYYAVAGNRLVALSGSKVRFSATGNPAVFDVTDYHEVPAGVVGTGIIGLEDRVYVFTTGGVFVVLNMALDLTDALGNPQQRLEQLNEDMILWDHAGLATWENAVLAPCADGLWLLPSNAPPQLLTRSIKPMYQGYVVAGDRCGLASVINGHYVLPVLNGPAVTDDLLLCRVDRPVDVRGFGRIYPWTSFKDAGGKIRAVAVRVTDPAREPVLLGAAQSGQLVTFGEFTPDGKADDHDGSTPAYDVVYRDWATGARNENTVKKLRLRYELITPSGAVITAYLGSNARPEGALWGSTLWGVGLWTLVGMPGFTALPTTAPATDGRAPFTFRQVNKRLRYTRLRLRCDQPRTRLVIRSVEQFVRPSGRM